MELIMDISISDATYSRLEKKAIGFDTPEQVIIRLLDQSDGIAMKKPEIIFYPNEDIFKKDLLDKKRAEITIYHKNGNRDIILWEAKRFTEKSNLRANLWSGYLRNWSEKGIVKVEITTLPNEKNHPEDEIAKIRLIAHAIGLKYDEMEELEGSYDMENSNNYGTELFIKFNDDAPKEILDKIDGLHNNTVYISADIFEQHN